MKPREKKPEIVYRIINRETGHAQGSYSRAYCDEFDFRSPEEARNANCHGMFKDTAKYAIAKYRVTYELLEPDVPCAPEQPTEPDKPLSPMDRAILTGMEKLIRKHIAEAVARSSYRMRYVQPGPIPFEPPTP